MNKWYMQRGEGDDIAVSVRIRLARNIEGYPFPNKMTAEDKAQVIEKVSDAIFSCNSPVAEDFEKIDMDKTSKAFAFSLAEKHLISPDFAENGLGRALILNKDESVSIMINEEDHIRIQVLSAGVSLDNAFDTATKIDTLFESALKYVFHTKLGYLTECPTNLGTGMRASIMLHLPALEAMGSIGQLSATVSKLGLTLRGTYGEGTNAKSAMYQLSNQVTLGLSEQEAIDNLKNITNQIISREKQARENMDSASLEDSIYRAFGLLKYARLISGDEFMNLLSTVRLGVSLGKLNLPLEKINQLLWSCQSATLQADAGQILDASQRDKKRAEIIRETLSEF